MAGYGFFASPGCCCLTGCTIYGDLFTSDTIGSNWTEVAGDWSISAGTLATDETSAVLIANQAHPDGNGSAMVLRVDIRFAAAGDRARALIAYLDADNYLFAELWIDANGCGRLRAYERVSGTTTAVTDELGLPIDLPVDAWHQLTLCFQPGEYPSPSTLRFRVRSAAGNLWNDVADVAPATAGDQAGLGTGGTVSTAIEFDSFEFLYHYDAVAHPNCPRCDADSNCTLHSDDFQRADADLPGCAWEEVAGDWDIASNKLTVASDDAILRNQTQHPDDDAHVLISFSFSAAASAELQVILDYEDDDNFLYVLLEPGSHGDCGRVSFWRRTAAVDAQLGVSGVLLGMTADAADVHAVVVCWQDEALRVTLTPASGGEYTLPSSHSVHGIEQAAAMPYVGFGTQSASQVWIDDFLLQRLHDAEHPTCPECDDVSCLIYGGEPRTTIADDTVMNCLWNVVAGTWTVNETTGTALSILTWLGGPTELFEATTSDALLVNESGHPGITAEGYLDLTSAVEAYVVSFDYGDQVRLILGYQDDENFLWAEFEYAADDESVGYLRIGKTVAGVETEIAEEATSVLGGQPHDSSDTSTPASFFRACYDGYELRAGFTNEALNSGGEGTSVVGDAGTGWNPGLSGLGTGDITSAVYFNGWRSYHDIYGGGDGCAPCLTGGSCGHCCENDGDDGGACLDRTPSVVLVRISNFVWDGTGCPQAPQLNDTFALPFEQTFSGTCRWRMLPHFCDTTSGGSPLYSQILFDLYRVSGAFRLYVQVNLYDPAITTGAGGVSGATSLRQILWSALPSEYSCNMACVPGDPSSEANQGLNCLAFLGDWTLVGNSPTTNAGDGFLSNMNVATVEVKALAL